MLKVTMLELEVADVLSICPSLNVGRADSGNSVMSSDRHATWIVSEMAIPEPKAVNVVVTKERARRLVPFLNHSNKDAAIVVVKVDKHDASRSGS